MEDFNENVTNILNSIKSLYKGCEGIECEDCPLYDYEIGTIEDSLCMYLAEGVINETTIHYRHE